MCFFDADSQQGSQARTTTETRQSSLASLPATQCQIGSIESVENVPIMFQIDDEYMICTVFVDYLHTPFYQSDHIPNNAHRSRTDAELLGLSSIRASNHLSVFIQKICQKSSAPGIVSSRFYYFDSPTTHVTNL